MFMHFFLLLNETSGLIRGVASYRETNVILHILIADSDVISTVFYLKTPLLTPPPPPPRPRRVVNRERSFVRLPNPIHYLRRRPYLDLSPLMSPLSLTYSSLLMPDAPLSRTPPLSVAPAYPFVASNCHHQAKGADKALPPN